MATYVPCVVEHPMFSCALFTCCTVLYTADVYVHISLYYTVAAVHRSSDDRLLHLPVY